MQGQAITKVQPVSPAGARRFNAARQVRVQIDISEAGRVTNAKAISGPLLLRDAAVEEPASGFSSRRRSTAFQ